ncbi:MAG: circularly permuted type 2 ATP-grasp protein, partial [Myxococcota bacterium]
MAAPAIHAFDEMRDDAGVRSPYRAVHDWLAKTPTADLANLSREAELLFRRLGITFAVYGEGGDPERLIPFDVVPRVIAADEWRMLSAGLSQRVRALNAFLADVYGAREILRAGRIPEAVVLANPSFRPEANGVVPPGGVYTHVSGIDVVRVGPSEFFVLEDNCRTPSGVSYMLENREAMLRLMPDLITNHRIASISRYPEELYETLRSVAPRGA